MSVSTLHGAWGLVSLKADAEPGTWGPAILGRDPGKHPGGAERWDQEGWGRQLAEGLSSSVATTGGVAEVTRLPPAVASGKECGTRLGAAPPGETEGKVCPPPAISHPLGSLLPGMQTWPMGHSPSPEGLSLADHWSWRMSQAHTWEWPLAGPGHMPSPGGTQDTWTTSHPWQRGKPEPLSLRNSEG